MGFGYHDERQTTFTTEPAEPTEPTEECFSLSVCSVVYASFPLDAPTQRHGAYAPGKSLVHFPLAPRRPVIWVY